MGKLQSAVAARLVVAIQRFFGFFALAVINVLPNWEGRDGVFALADDESTLLPGVERVDFFGDFEFFGASVLVYHVDESARSFE